MFHRYQTTLQEPQDRFKQKQAPPAIPLKAEGGHEVDEPLEEELDELRQREHQERTVSTLRHKLAMGEDARYIENVRIMNENVLLLTEINVLRKDLQATQQRTQRLLNSVAKMGGDGKDRDKVVEDIVQELQHGPPVFAASLKQARRSGAGGGGVAESLPFLLPPIKKRQQ
ncbi:hypothetical protein DFJ73DRAFT_823938 [Zopfochytrium polystomum]|nr:hypothetical protein DFJ73DRAFT_823938 [Zopfochytrium polystomum]